MLILSKFYRLWIVLIVLVLLGNFGISTTQAQDACGFIPAGLRTTLCLDVLDPATVTAANIFDIILNLFYWLVVIAGILAVGVILWSAILFMTAGGDQSRQERARAWLRYGIIGIIVAIISFTIISLISSFLTGGF